MMKKRIEDRIQGALQVQHIDVINETHMHNVPPDSESHWKVVVVSEDFGGVRAVRRHRKIYAALKEELKQGIHALALVTMTPDEWAAAASPPESPPCLGGSKGES